MIYEQPPTDCEIIPRKANQAVWKALVFPLSVLQALPKDDSTVSAPAVLSGAACFVNAHKEPRIRR